MKRRENNIDYCRLKRDWSAQCVQRCSECRYICKGNKRIIKDDKLQILGISFSIPNGVATIGSGETMCAHPSIRRPRHCAGSGLARKYKNGLEAQYRRWSRHPDETREYFTATGFHGRYPEAVFRDRVRKLGMGFVWPTQPFGWHPCVFIFYYL